jgi:hypothetical protein
LIYKNKRYTLLLNDTKTKIHELSRIWEHASKNASQSQGERG